MPIQLPTPPRLRRFYHRIRFEWIGRAPRYQDSLAAANAARARRDWPMAALHFEQASRVRPSSAGVKVQLGHALKESGRIGAAEAAYRSAIRSAPQAADGYIHLGHALKLQDRRPEAADAYAKAIALAPFHLDASAELIAIGARDRMPTDLYGRQAAARSLEALSHGLTDTRAALEAMRQASTFPAEAWAAFRRTYPVLPPPKGGQPMREILVLVDARGAAPSALRATLSALVDLADVHWRALILADGSVADHPVASRARIDPRINFHHGDPDDCLAGGEAPGADVLLLSAGCVPDPRALGWFAFAADRAHAAMVYADHDHQLADWRDGPTPFEPVLFGAPGPLDLATTPAPPAMLYLRGVDPARLATVLVEFQGAACRRELTLWGLRTGRKVTHAPLALASLIVRSHPEASDGSAPVHEAVPVLSASAAERRIRVVIPTRDQAGLLEACVRSLRDMALRPELLDIVVMNNRSIEPATEALLRRLSDRGEAVVMPADEPFNWARFNNLPVAEGDHDILVFANNDIEMLSVGWDDQVRRLLADDSVGVVGARLVYDDRTIQHAGIVLGAVGGRPIHEGRHAPPSDGGPQLRWCRTREAAAVTGAFMAVRGETFVRVGGFDETLAIAYNDVDFCLRIREAGFSVVQSAEIEAVHHESKTRGLALDAEKIAWDDAEFGDMYRSWGEMAVRDPYINPVWTFAVERSFDGLRPPTLCQILEGIDNPRPVRATARGSDA